MNDARLLYNVGVSRLIGTSDKSDKYKLRNEFVIEKNTKVTDKKILNSMKRTPKDIRAKAIFESCVAHDLSLKKIKTLNPEYVKYEKASKYCNEAKEKLEFIPKYMAKVSNLKMRRKKDQYSHIFIPKTACKKVYNDNNNVFLNIYPKYKVGKILIGNDINEITSDFQIVCHNKLNTWWIITSEPVIVKPKNNDKKEYKTIAFDPGVRTFLTGVDSCGNILEIGKDWSKIESKMNYDMKSLRGVKDRRKRFNFLKSKRNTDLNRRKLHNKIDDMHKKTARYLLDNYDVIVLPKLRTKSILKKESGLGKNINRQISLLAHCKFHDYITWKAYRTMEDKVVINQNEAYTTQTCFHCGRLNKIGASKTYQCMHCKSGACDRDIQSSLNILTKYMSSYSSRCNE